MANDEIFPKLHHYWFVDPEHPISADDFHGLMACMVETYGPDPDAKGPRAHTSERTPL